MSFDVHLSDGSVLSSSQQMAEEFLTNDTVMPMYGIILDVYPSDSEKNYSAQGTFDLRGHRHECTVLAAENFALQPDVLLDNVVIPPQRPSGIDNFDEDLPRGCSQMIDESEYKDNFEKIDYGKLDGEWCIINFVGGSIDHPYIAAWWPHPSNRFDPATSGSGNEGGALKQVDIKKNRSRFLRRVNGSYVLVSKAGDVYLDTSEANSSVTVKDGKIDRKLIDKGGNVQVDLAKKAQLELNFNDKEHKNPRIGAGSTSQLTVNGETVESDAPVTEPDLPHSDNGNVQGDPKVRETSRTFLRAREYELLVKSSKILVFADAQGGFDGDIELVCDKLTKIKAGSDVVVESPNIQIGSASADEPMVLGTQWIDIMTQLITQLTALCSGLEVLQVATGVGPSDPNGPINKATFQAIRTQLTGTIQASIAAKNQVSDFIFGQKAP